MTIYYLGTEKSRRQLDHTMRLPAKTIVVHDLSNVQGRRGPAVLFLAHDAHRVDNNSEIRDLIRLNHEDLEIVRLA